MSKTHGGQGVGEWGGGVQLGVRREDRGRLEARWESWSSELKPGLPGCFEDIYHSRRMEHVYLAVR